jgi:hypothetical protein
MEVFCFLTCKLRVYFRYKPDFFSQAQIPVQNKVTLLVVREGDTYNRYNLLLRVCLLFISSDLPMSEQVVPSAATQSIVVQFLNLLRF